MGFPLFLGPWVFGPLSSSRGRFASGAAVAAVADGSGGFSAGAEAAAAAKSLGSDDMCVFV